MERQQKQMSARRPPEVAVLLGIAGLFVACTGLIYKTLAAVSAWNAGIGGDWAGALWVGLMPFGFAASIALAAGSGALLLGRSWGRKLLLAYAVAAAALTVPDLVVRVARQDEWLAAQRAQTEDVPSWAGGAMTFVWIALAAAKLVFPALLLYHLTRPAVRRAYR